MAVDAVELKPRNLKICPPVSANQLLLVADSSHYQTIVTPNIDPPFGERFIDFYLVTGRYTNIIGVQRGQMGGWQINNLLYANKPESSAYGIDTDDLLKDWKQIEQPGNETRLANHMSMYGFKQFMAEKDLFWDLIKRAQGNNWMEDPNYGAKAVIWWRINGEERRVRFEALESQTSSQAVAEINRRHTEEDRKKRIIPSTILGVWLLEYLSPEIRADASIWKPNDHYSPHYLGDGFNMGTTQVGAMGLRYADHFVNDPRAIFIKRAEEYIFDTATRLS